MLVGEGRGARGWSQGGGLTAVRGQECETLRRGELSAWDYEWSRGSSWASGRKTGRAAVSVGGASLGLARGLKALSVAVAGRRTSWGSGVLATGAVQGRRGVVWNCASVCWRRRRHAAAGCKFLV